MKIFLRFFAVLVLFTLLVTSVFASDVTNAEYLTTILVTNNGSAATNVCVPFTLDTSTMISGNMLSSDALDVVAKTSNGIDIAVMPGLSSTWMLFIPSIGANTQITIYLYSKGTIGGNTYYFPGDGGMVVTENASLDITNSGNYTFSVWFDSTSTGYLLNKAGDITIQGNGDGSVTVTPYTDTTANSTFKPNAAGSMTGLTPSAGTNWGCVSDNNDATYVSKATSTYVGDLYNTANHTTESGIINYVEVRFRNINFTDTNYLKPMWKIGSATYNGTEVTAPSASYTNFSQTYTTSPATGLAWTWEELDGAEIGLWVKHSGGANTGFAEISYIVNYTFSTSSASVSSPVIPAGEHTFMVYVDGGNIGIKVDDAVANTTAFAGNIPASGTPFTFVSGGIATYVNSIEVWKGGVRTGYWSWEYGATFSDQSLNGNTGTPSFRTTTSDADVSAAIINQESLITSESPATAESEAWSMLTTLLTVTPSGLYSEGGILFPGGQIIQDFSDDTRYPVPFYLYPLAIGSSIALGLLVMAKTYKPAHGIRGSLMLQAGTSLLCMVLWVFGGGGVIAGWILIPFGLWCAVLLLWRNPYNPIS